MDCRKMLLPALWLLTSAIGCATDRGTSAPAVRETAPPPLASNSPYNPPKTELEGPKRVPKAATCVSAGDFFAGEAVFLDKDSTAQEQMRNKARIEYQQAIAIDPTHIPAYQSLARLYVEMEDFEHAVATYRKALQLQPRNSSVWFGLGMCQARRKDWPASIDSLSHAVEFDPENRQYVNFLGFALARAGQYQASLNCFGRQSNEAMAHYQLARMLQHLQKYDLARQCVLTALQKDPNLKPAQELLTQLGDIPPASAPIRTASYTEEAPAAIESQPTTQTPTEESPREVSVAGPSQPVPQRTILPQPPPMGNWQPARR